MSTLLKANGNKICYKVNEQEARKEILSLQKTTFMTFLEIKTYRYVKTEHTFFVFQAFFIEIEFKNSITGRI